MARPTRQYEAFISYSHAADNDLAAALQRSLNRIARPPYKWWEWWPPRVFRDQTNLAAAADLGGEIRSALLESDSFVLLASPSAAASHWVNQEVTMWCATKPHDRLFIALTGGHLAWDDTRSDFDPARTNALPPALYGVFDAEPLWVDLTGASAGGTAARDPRFLDGAATLAAAIREAEKYVLIGEDARQHRRTRQLVAGAASLLGLLAIAASLAAAYALIQRNRADERARLATSRQLAAEALVALDTDPEQSVVLAARAATTAPTDEAADALRQALRTSRLRTTIDAGAPVLDTAVDPTGRLAAAALEDGSIHTWTLEKGRPEARLQLPGVFVERVQFSKDGRRLLGAGEAGVVVWPTNGTRQLIPIFDSVGKPLAAAFSPSDNVVATGDFDGAVRLWRTETGRARLIQKLPAPRTESVRSVSFSGDGSVLAAAGGSQALVWMLREKGARLFRADNARVFRADNVSAIAVSPDSSHVAVGDLHGRARIWSLRSGAAAIDLNGHSNKIRSLAFSPHGNLLVTASNDETARIWDVRTGTSLAELRGHRDIVNSASFAPDGKTIVTGGDDGTIRVWAVASDPVRVELGGRDKKELLDVAIDRSGERVAAAGKDLTARIWNVNSRRPLRTLRHGSGDGEWATSVDFSDDGRLVVTAGVDGTAKVWSPWASSGRPLATLGRRSDPEVFDAALSPDGQLVATAGRAVDDEPTIRLWRWRTKQVMTHGGFRHRADAVAFSPGGALLAGAGRHKVRVWRVADGAQVAVLELRAPGGLTSLAFDRAGERLAAGSRSDIAAVWDLRSGRLPIAVLRGHSRAVAAVAFSADRRFVATASEDGLAKVWTVPDGDLVTTLPSRAQELEGVVFAPHRRLVAVAGTGGRVTIFDCMECRPLPSLVCLARSRVTPEVRAREEDVFGRCD